MGFFRASPLEIKLREKAMLQHQAEQIRQQYAEPKERQRQEERAAANAMRQIESQHAAAVRQLADQEKAAWSAWALEPRYTGGHAADPLVVTHHRSGRVPVIVLPPAAAVAAGDEALSRGAEALIRADRALMQDERFMERAKIADQLYDEVRKEYGTLLARLRSESWWRGLTVAAGLADKRTDPHLWTGTYSSGKESITTYTVPSIIGVRVASDGLRIRVASRLGDTPERWRKSTAELRAAFRSAGAPVGDLKIVDGGGGSIAICLMDADPLSEPLPSVITPYDVERGRSLVGKAADGSPVYLTIKNNSTVIVGGMQGGGKTASILPVLAGMAGHVELHVLDGGASGEWEPLRALCATYDDSGEIAACGTLMQRLLDGRVARMARINETGHTGFWDIPPAERERAGLFPIIVVIEEAPQYMGKGQATPDDKKVAEANRGRVAQVVKLMRKAGVTVFILAQKPTDDELPTVVRDMGGQRLCFRLDSDVAAATVLGDSAYQEPKPTSIPAGRPGRFVARVDGRGSLLGQAVYVPVDGLRDFLNGKSAVPSQVAAPAPTAAPSPGPFAGVELGVGGGVTAPVVGVPQAVAEVGTPAPGPVRQAPPALDVASLTEEQRQALLTALLSAPVPDDGGEAQATPAEPPAAPTPDPEPPAAPTISGFDL
ncbi:hypothetical protein [Mycobacteroides abscessus]|uniref:hypothetical protein n=1 Tax=Mycobacteroides abscessus TaxID=36809 RepID=UPI0019D2B600|nr:hypothetical protein [Mycobacteroides abscessus]MBN7457551.1 hypothetical protein [Mycobacteroides abscessus subsp. abscessus]